MLKKVLAILLLLAPGALADGVALDGYQWSVTLTQSNGQEFAALLWVPPQAERIRGVLMGEREYIANDPAVRAAAAAEKLAIVLLRPHFDALFRYWENDSPARLQHTLDKLAAISGYGELAVAPLFPFGHSVSSVYASHVAYWNPDRVFGLLAYKGALVEPPPVPGATVAGVPALVITGQFEEFGPGPSGVLRDWEDRETGWRISRERYLRMRDQEERNLICFAVDGGSTHMAWSARNGELTALFLRKAAALRIPDWPVDMTAPVRCRAAAVTNGWLTSAAIQNPALLRAGPVATWQGNPKSAWWHADEELAQAWLQYHAGRFAKRTQYVMFVHPATGKFVFPGNDLRLRLPPHWIGPDTFQVAADFLMETRDRYAPPEPPLGHAAGPIRFRLDRTGDCEQTGSNTFRVLRYGAKEAQQNLLAWHPGDDQYRWAEQPAFVRIPLLTKGTPQTITFPALADRRPGDPPVTLAATSSSRLPVSYAVDYGPARIEKDRLVLLPRPLRAKGPLEVKVTAYQWGSAIEPFVATAPPVSQRFRILGDKQ